MHSERCMSGSARGHAKLPVARSVRRACSTQPYVPTWAGFIYLAIVLDVWSRRVVGWAIGVCVRYSSARLGYPRRIVKGHRIFPSRGHSNFPTRLRRAVVV